MTIEQFIKRLQEMPQDLVVLRRRGIQEQGYWYEAMDDWWPQFVEVINNGRPGIYVKPYNHDDDPRIDALEL
jgi:hypothetical protein